MWQSVTVLAFFITLAQTKTISTEEFYVPSTIVFNDIYGINYHPSSTEDDIISTTTFEPEDYSVDSKPRFVEFRPAMIESTTVPPPMYIDSNALSKAEESKVSTTTTESPELIVKVVPIKLHYQRGLLDLLFPPTRVKSFKNVFDSIRRVLSHTFRR